MRVLLQRIRKLLKEKRFRRAWRRGISMAAAVLVFVTTYALVLPAITMEGQAACGIPEHQHDDSCYEEVLICGQEESEGHHHDESCYTVTQELVCGLEEHVHSVENGCYDEEGNLICQIPEHIHDDSCYQEKRVLTCGLEESEGHKHTAACYEKVLTCELEAHTHSPECYHTGNSAVNASADASLQEDSGDIRVVDASEGSTGKNEIALEADAASTEEAAAENLEEEYREGILEAIGDDYSITLNYTAEARIPENAVLQVREITEVSDEEAYQACLEQTREQVAVSSNEEEDVDTLATRFFDIEILATNETGEMEKIEPAAPVVVSILLPDQPETNGSEAPADPAQTASDPAVLHFAEEGLEWLEAALYDRVSGTNDQDEKAETGAESDMEAGREIQFEAESFSVYGVVYTEGRIRKTVISASGDTYEITVTYGEDAQIPDSAVLQVREITEADSEFASLKEEAQAAFLAKYDSQPDHLVTFDITIMDGETEIEPAEGSSVSVEIRLKNELAEEMRSAPLVEETDAGETDDLEKESAQESSSEGPLEAQMTEEESTGEFTMSGSGIWLNTTKIEEQAIEESSDSESMTLDVIHHTTGKEASFVEHVDCTFDEESIDLCFTTDAFSSYSIGGDVGESSQNTQVNILSDLRNLKVGDSVYFINNDNYEIRYVSVEGGAVLSQRGDNNHKVLEVYKPCTFEIYNKYNEYDKQTVTVADRTHTPYSNTIDTVDNKDIGVTLSLFDYDLDKQLNEWWNRTYDGNFSWYGTIITNTGNYYLDHGINKDHDLKFWAGGPTYTSDDHPEYNAWLEDNLGTTIVNSTEMVKVGDETYPQLTNGQSLAYLFTKSTDTNADREYYKANHLFSEENGYYIYNSGMTSDNESGHYAYFNKETGDFEVYDKTYYYTKDGVKFPIGFFPFTQLDEDAVSGGDLSSNQYPNHHFGMSMSVDFDIPEDKIDPNDNHITFEFSGDDDMWVFVDGKLVLDIGGVHQPIGGKIDFTTGEVTYQDKNGNAITDNVFSPDLNALIGSRGTAVNSYGQHTLQVFYLERGGGDSNCMIKFNTIPYKRIQFDKIDANNNRIPGAVFKLFKDENCTQALMVPRSSTEGGQTINYYEEAVSTSTDDGYVIFDKIPVGTYYMKEVTTPDHYDSDGKVYTAVVTASRVGDPDDDNYATIYWKNKDNPIGEGVVNYEKFPIEVTKKWVKAGTSEEADWPEGAEISYRIIRHTYIEVDGADDAEIPGTEEVVFTAEDDALLTGDHPSHVVTDLAKVGKWNSPIAVTPELEALGIAANTEYPVKYKYTVEEYPEGSAYTGTLLPVQATTEATDVDITVSGGETEKGDQYLLTNEITELEVLKTWTDGNEKHENDSVTVQLYRTTIKSETPIIPPDEPDDETISILVSTNWVYEDETSANEKDIPGKGTIKAQISDGEHTWTVDLTPDNNWTAVQSDLPKTDGNGKNITYTVSYLQQETSFPGITNVESIVVTQPSSVTGSNGKVTLKGTVKKPEPVITTMTVPFTGTWVNSSGETVTPPDNAVITAIVKNADGSVAATVVLNKANNWTTSKELPCSNGYEDFHYTVDYLEAGDYVTGVDGTKSFSGEGSQVNAVGMVTPPVVSDGKMAVQVIAYGMVATGNDSWQIQMNDGIYATDQYGNRDNSKNQYRFPENVLKGSVTSSTITDMNVKNADNQTIRYKLHVQAEQITKGTISVIDPSGEVVTSQNFTNGWTGDLVFDAQPGTFTVRIDGENASTSNANSQKTKTMRLNAAPLKAASGTTKTFTDDINHSGLKLPADADPVGDPVVLRNDEDSAQAWKHMWENLPVADEEGNTYYYYVKEVSATTGEDVQELGAVYQYVLYDGESGRIHKVTIENTPKIIEVEVGILKLDKEDQSTLSGVPFTLWKKGGAGTSGGEYAQVEGCIDSKTGADGKITFTGLKPGDYKITEGPPLTGYLSLSEEVMFTIESDGTITGFTDTDMVKHTAEGTFTFKILNEKAAMLPAAGGPGSSWFWLLGILLVGSAGAGLAVRKRCS